MPCPPVRSRRPQPPPAANQNLLPQTCLETQAEEQAPIERRGEGTTVTARSIEKLVETVLGGGEVSAEEEQRLNEALLYSFTTINNFIELFPIFS